MSGSFNPDIHVPGLWRCAKCNFTLVQSNLNAADGTVTARDDAGDKCPNDGAPLWRVTWKQHATEMMEEQETLADRVRQNTEIGCAALISSYLRREIGELMHQAEHWASKGEALAVHHRVNKADAYYQIVSLMERDPAKGWKLPFDQIRHDLDRPSMNEAGTYPPNAELHEYRDPRKAVSKVGIPHAAGAA